MKVKFSELQFFPANTQGNVNGTAVIPSFLSSKDEHLKSDILTINLKPVGDYPRNKTGLVLHHFIDEKDYLVPVQSDLEITGTSGAAEPVSIDAYVGESDVFYLAVAFAVMKSDSNPKFFLNIYRSRLDYLPKQAMKHLSDHYIKFDLDCCALQITHTYVCVSGEKKMVFIMAMGDSLPSSTSQQQQQQSTGTSLKFTDASGAVAVERAPLAVFLYVMDSEPENIANGENSYEADQSHSVRRWFPPSRKSSVTKRTCFTSFKYLLHEWQDVLPEVKQIQSPKFPNDRIFHMSFYCDVDFHYRLSAFGWESGRFHLSMTDVQQGTVLRYLNGRHCSPITQLQFIHNPWHVSHPELSSDCEKDVLIPSCDILISCGFEASVVYEDIFLTSSSNTDECNESFLERQFLLPQSDIHDSVLCSCIADVDMDGNMEILLGTFQHILLIYKSVPVTTDTTERVEKATDDGHRLLTPGISHQYELLWKRKCTGPIHGIKVADVTGDGVNEILITTTRGLHVLQFDIEHLLPLLSGRLT